MNNKPLIDVDEDYTRAGEVSVPVESKEVDNHIKIGIALDRLEAVGIQADDLLNRINGAVNEKINEKRPRLSDETLRVLLTLTPETINAHIKDVCKTLDDIQAALFS